MKCIIIFLHKCKLFKNKFNGANIMLTAKKKYFWHWYKHDYEMETRYNKALYINNISCNCSK